MKLKDIQQLERAQSKSNIERYRLGIGLLFILGIMVYVNSVIATELNLMLILAAVIGGYMAINIGANDVANNVGPAVGSRAMTLTTALFIAAIFEAAGAIIAGGTVVGTIRNGIIDPSQISDPDTFVWIMIGALMAAALWLNIATAVGAPVSTTHSIVGAILGGGIAAAGTDIVAWDVMGKIAASWVVSPVMGGIVAAVFLFIIKRRITYQSDMTVAARATVPWLVAFMVWSFSTYLILKGLNRIWKADLLEASLVGLMLAAVLFFVVRSRLNANASNMVNSKEGVNKLFTIPLIFAAALLSFAHGSNDVANAIGPLAAIVDVYTNHPSNITGSAAIPLWVLIIGALGISLGLALYGPKVIRTIGSEITELDQMRAYCIAMAATITVIIASQLGLPVSSTHIAVGGVFGVGFLREYLKRNYERMVLEIKAHHPEGDQEAIDAFLSRFADASIPEKDQMLKELKARSKADNDPANFSKLERKGLRKVYRKELVKRSQIMKIVSAWVITVPATAVLSAMLFFMLKGMLGS